jgi:hypothetical protein
LVAADESFGLVIARGDLVWGGLGSQVLKWGDTTEKDQGHGKTIAFELPLPG